MINSFSGKYRFLSNFYPSGFQAGRLWYPTNEHFFQAMKNRTEDYREMVAKAPAPKDAKRMGSKKAMMKKGYVLRADWDDIKDDVMLFGLRLKFGDSNPRLQVALLDTGDEELVEGNRWHDTYWGVCNGECWQGPHDPEGENRLGKLLMQVRKEIS